MYGVEGDVPCRAAIGYSMERGVEGVPRKGRGRVFHVGSGHRPVRFQSYIWHRPALERIALSIYLPLKLRVTDCSFLFLSLLLRLFWCWLFDK